MLVLSRKREEKIICQVPPSDKTEEIEITVVHIEDRKVKLGFDADQKINIARSEILDKYSD